MTITKFDKTSCRLLQDECVAALQAVAAKHGLSVQQAGGSLGDVEFKSKFLFKINDPKIVADNARAEWNKYCSYFSMQPEDFGRRFICQGKEYEVSGLDLGRRTKPIHAKRVSDGKTFIWPSATIKSLLGTSALVKKFELIKGGAAEAAGEAKAS
jgi:hypothetical protein